MGRQIARLDWTVYDSDAAGFRVLRFTDGEGYNHPDAAGFYFPYLDQAGLFLVSVSPAPTMCGPSVAGGAITFINTDFVMTDPTSLLGQLWGDQSVLDFGIVGHPVELWIGDEADAPSDHVSVLVGYAAGLSISKTNLTLQLKDPLLGFADPLATNEYAGDNALPAGLEGTADDTKGDKKPVIGGRVYSVAGRQVNTSRDIYQFGDGSAYDIPALYQSGVAKTKGAARTTATIDNGVAPTAGQYDYLLGPSGVYARLGTTTTDPITADVDGPAHTNLILRSEELDNAEWTKTNCTITANAANNSKGAATADKIVEDASAAAEHYARQLCTVTASSLMSTSLEVKASGRTFARVSLTNSADTSGIRLDLDLSTGEATRSTFGTASSANHGVASLGNGWYRVAVVGIVDAASTSAAVKVQPASALGTVSYNGNGADGILATRVQFEIDAPTDYLVTTGAAVSACKTAPADIARDFVTARHAQIADLGDIMAFNHLANAASGFFNRDNVNLAAALDHLFVGVLGRWYLENGVFRCFKLRDPEDADDTGLRFLELSGDTSAASTDIDIKNWSFQALSGIGGLVPVYKAKVGYKRYWQTQTSGLDAAITQARKAELQSEFRWTDPDDDAAVLTKNPDAQEINLPTCLNLLADAETLRAELLSLFGVGRPLIQVQSELDPDVAALLVRGQSVTVNLPALGYTARKMLILGKLYNRKTHYLDAYLWG